MEDFIKYAKEEFNCDVVMNKNNNPDTFESIFFAKYSVGNVEDATIRAANKAGLSRGLLLDTLYEKGVLAVYNLGMKHMYKYLEENESDSQRISK